MNTLHLRLVDPIDRDYFPDGGFFITFNTEVTVRMAQGFVQQKCNDLLSNFPYSGPHVLNFSTPKIIGQKLKEESGEKTDDETDDEDEVLPPVPALPRPKRQPYEAYVWRTAIKGTPVISIGNEGRLSRIWEIVCDTSELEEVQEALIERIIFIFEEMHERLSAVAEKR